MGGEREEEGKGREGIDVHVCGLRGANQTGCSNAFLCKEACVALTVPKLTVTSF